MRSYMISHTYIISTLIHMYILRKRADTIRCRHSWSLRSCELHIQCVLSVLEWFVLRVFVFKLPTSGHKNIDKLLQFW